MTVFDDAAVGPVAEVQLFPLSDVGQLRVMYGIKQMPIACSPALSDDFVWVVEKVGPNQVSLAPRDPHDGNTMRAFTSASADWKLQGLSEDFFGKVIEETGGVITTFELETQGLLFVSLKVPGVGYVAVDQQPLSASIPIEPGTFGDMENALLQLFFSCHIVRATGGAGSQSTVWFMKVVRPLQPTAGALPQALDADKIQQMVAGIAVADARAAMQSMARAFGAVPQ